MTMNRVQLGKATLGVTAAALAALGAQGRGHVTQAAGSAKTATAAVAKAQTSRAKTTVLASSVTKVSPLTSGIQALQATNSSRYPKAVAGFLNQIISGAITGWTSHRILPSLTAAQAILESGWGGSSMATRYHNLFGMKGSYNGATVRVATREYYGGAYHTIYDNFRVYPNDAASIADHATVLATSARYANLIGVTNATTATNRIKADGYATAPDYPAKLRQLIATYRLTAWDQLAFQNAGGAGTGAGATTSSTAGVTYTVRRGDTLTAIARRYGTTVSALAALNGLKNPNVLMVGQKLVVKKATTTTTSSATTKPATKPTTTTKPATSTSKPAAKPTTATATKPAAKPTVTSPAVTYTVRAGDTLYAIARSHQTTVAKLVSLNKLANPNRIGVGQRLVIRAATTAVKATATQATTAKATPTKAAAKTTAKAAAAKTYVVRAGDTLWGIATRNHTTVAKLTAKNHLTNANYLRIGQRLVLA
ncbi:LysM peptidoglycan-binding domain-containing protein [Lacticaseibacillus parakribbianus]|uniref:LysM peptidoglycan-binding domain-containing protein n=1 Tax=Lacticaseibacillus parakribbianus TaxID=2970927 RepID=UPI0021CB7C25|nr:LysM peptidoglycan-binding domain-containing protein [Lacticaseibacillus parakribbianus]